MFSKVSPRERNRAILLSEFGGFFLATAWNLIQHEGFSIIEILLIAHHHVRAFRELWFIGSGSRLAA